MWCEQCVLSLPIRLSDKIAAFCRQSVCASVGASRSTAKRWEIGLWLLWGVDRKSPPSYRWTPFSDPATTFSPNCGWQPIVKSCIANCCQTVPDTMVVCIDGNISLPYTTVPSSKFRGTPSSKIHAEHRSYLLVPQTFHIHVGLFTFVYS